MSRRHILHVSEILKWADAHFARTKKWPTKFIGRVLGPQDEKWFNIGIALSKGLRGLPGGSSLPQLLAEHRGVRNRNQLPKLTHKQILAWADAHYKRTGRWPNLKSGSIAEAPWGETWSSVAGALVRGTRGRGSGPSLSQLLSKHRGVRNRRRLPKLTFKQILAWADAHYKRTGRWPNLNSGPITDAPGENWMRVGHALLKRGRGLKGGSSLPQLLFKRRGVRYRRALPKLTHKQILAWADAHYKRTGHWPKVLSGAIAESPGETWSSVAGALKRGTRGLGSDSTLSQLLYKLRGVLRWR